MNPYEPETLDDAREVCDENAYQRTRDKQSKETKAKTAKDRRKQFAKQAFKNHVGRSFDDN